MEHVSFPGMQMDIVGNSPNYQGFPGASEQIGVMEPMVSFNHMLNASVVPSTAAPNYQSSVGGKGFNPFWMSTELFNEDAVILSSVADKQLPMKRKADMEFNSYNFVTQQQIFPNKPSVNLADGFSSSGAMRQPALKRSGPSVPHSQSISSKKMVRPDAVTGKSISNRVQPVKRQSIHSSTKLKQESSDSVRSKMRESLASALALASPKLDKDSKKDQSDATVTHNVSLDSNDLTVIDSNDPGLSSTKGRNIQTPAPELIGSSLNFEGAFQQFPYTSMLVDGDSQFGDSFTVKDDLLQGNGLSWAFDFDSQMSDGKASEIGSDQNSIGSEAKLVTLTPVLVAFKIEAELFKLFSGVNKKYKEKGRSLLFNLKDRNNPELRERVMSGEISPEGLCSMSAEELASKELSEWRTAKAEELAQLKVLPDTEVDIRRLVRKTHKGEYQVELEHDDNIVADLSVGTSILSLPQPRKDPKVNSSKLSLQAEDAGHVKESSVNQDNLGSVVIPADGDDLMQGMMMEESKGPERLPPVVSLDEFMESLNSEPPFENLSSDAGRNTPVLHESLKAPSKASQASINKSPSKEPEAVRTSEANTASRSVGSPKKKAISAEEPQYAWEGALQFNNSSSVTVCGLYKSGEKTSTKQWPSSLEIKGRVRLGAFEKFLQELPMSRTRAVMVLKLELKDKESKTQLSSLSEAIDSYTSEERLGYAEPVPGVEIYLSPRTPRVAEMVKYDAPVEMTGDGLIGVVVWRRAKSSKQSTSNKLSGSKKQAAVIRSSLRPPKVNHKAAAFATLTPSVLNNVQCELGGDDDDDGVPPGFGPASGGGDEDDLPEFNFSAQMNAPPLPRVVADRNQGVDRVRELIQKYGRSGGGPVDDLCSGFEPWKDDEDDDDDDIPEWRPGMHLQPHQQATYGGARISPAAEQLLGGLSQTHMPLRRHGRGWRRC